MRAASHPVVLVARREITERLRRPGYWVFTAVTVALVAGFLVLPRLSGDLSRPAVEVGAADGAVPAEVADGLDRSLHVRIRLRPVGSRAEAETLLRAGELHVAVTGGEVLLRHGVADGDDAAPGRVAQALATVLALRTTPPLAVRSLEPASSRPLSGRLNATFGEILIFMLLLTYGSWVMSGVVEEKSSGVAEVLLSAVRPATLLFGKVVGIGVVAGVQAALLAVTAAVTSIALGADLLRAASGGYVLAAVGAFVLGYLLYGCAYAMAGSTVSDATESGSASGPILAPLVGGHVLVVSTLPAFGETAMLRILSFLPPTAPLAMSSRIGLGTAAAWEVLVSTILLLGGVLAVARLAGVVYGRSILHRGKRLRIVEAIRRA